jgi:hypothetical protein
MANDGMEPFLPRVIGTEIRKRFEEYGKYYKGHVVAGPFIVKGEKGRHWKVRYEDGDCEDMLLAQIRKWAYNVERTAASPASPSRTTHSVTATAATTESVTPTIAKKRKATAYENLERDLRYRVGVSEIEVADALTKLMKTPPPHSMNEAMRLIHQQKIEREQGGFNEDDDGEHQQVTGKFRPAQGLRICKYYEGCAYYGTVTSEPQWKTDDFGNDIKTWEVTFDEWENEDGTATVEDFDFNELLANQASRPRHMAAALGRQLCALEMFSGCSIVTEEFANRKWRVRSIDNSDGSCATDKVDIMKMTFQDIQMVPDFLWASPPCFTYSNLSGGRHRSAQPGRFDKTPEAHEHNRYLARLFWLCNWTKKHRHHMVVVFENPDALLAKMPLMTDFEEKFGLVRAKVNYCALGRFDMKPTLLWTNVSVHLQTWWALAAFVPHGTPSFCL